VLPRIMLFVVVAGLATFGVGAVALAEPEVGEDAAFAREEDAEGVIVSDDDDDLGGGTGTNGGTGNTNSATSGQNSNDNTNSAHTPRSNDQDASRGDLTRDRTKDGPGTSTRDRSANQTNDGTINDTR
jgi:hypothetical protein